MTMNEVCKQTHMTPRQIRRFVDSGALECSRVLGGYRHFTEKAVDDFLLKVIRFNSAAREVGFTLIKPCGLEGGKS